MIETIFVDRNGVKVMINKVDFNEEIESVWSDEEKKPTNRELLIIEATELGLEFVDSIKNKDLSNLILEAKAKTEGGE